MRKVPTYILLDHLCRFCGTGRVMQQTNSGPTGGGWPVYCCATCGKASAHSGPEAICYCNAVIDRGGLPYATMCQRQDIDDETRAAMRQREWHCRRTHYGLEVWWRYEPGYTSRPPDHERAERYLQTGDPA